MNNSERMGLAIVSVMTLISNPIGEPMPTEQNWLAVNDGVMGGVSKGKAEVMKNGSLRFSGIISFENNGGFASIRHSCEGLPLNESTGIRLRLKGDGKTYQFRVRTTQQLDGVAYKHDFPTRLNEWSEVELEWSDFVPTFRGRPVPGAPER